VKGSIDLLPNDLFRERDPGESLGPKLNRVWKPVVAAVHGLCAGGAFCFVNDSEIMRMILMGNGERIGPETTLRISLVSEVVKRKSSGIAPMSSCRDDRPPSHDCDPRRRSSHAGGTRPPVFRGRPLRLQIRSGRQSDLHARTGPGLRRNRSRCGDGHPAAPIEADPVSTCRPASEVTTQSISAHVCPAPAV